jgi:hypothetical protein
LHQQSKKLRQLPSQLTSETLQSDHANSEDNVYIDMLISWFANRLYHRFIV